MKVKDIIKTAGTLLSKDNVVGFLIDENTNNDKNTLRDVNVFITLLNCLLCELAGTYIPMKKVENLNGETQIFFKNLSENVVRILSVFKKDGEKISYKQDVEKIQTSSPAYYIEYEYMPAYYDLNDVIGYSHKDVSKTVLAHGLCCEYLLSEARYSEAMIFHEKYVNGIASHKKCKNSKTVARVWQ